MGQCAASSSRPSSIASTPKGISKARTYSLAGGTSVKNRPVRATSVRRLFPRSQKFKRRVLLVGLDAAGKTSILNRVGRGMNVPTTPTEGFGAETVWFNELEITLWDVGGQDKLRPLWRNYFEGVQGLVFVVDSTDIGRMSQAAAELRSCLSDVQLSDAVLLVLANKQDVRGALSSLDVERSLGLGDGGETRRVIGSRSSNVMSCSAAKDDGINEALAWLCSAMKPL